MIQNQVEYIDFIKRRLEQTEGLLSVKQQQINTLLQITEAVNQNMPSEALFKIFEYVLRTQLNIGKLMLLVFDDEWKLACAHNVSEEAQSIDPDMLQDYKELHFVQHGEYPVLNEFEIVISLVQKGRHVAFLLLGELFNKDVESKEEKLNFIKTITSIIVVSYENRRLAVQQVQKQILERELSLASEVQMMLIPQQPPSNGNIDISAIYLPHKEIGGDYYDVIDLSDQEIALVICDVSGKGISAGLLMANFQATLRTMIYKDLPLEQLVASLNTKLCDITKGDKHITLFLAIYNYETRLLRYINAGHNPSLLYNDGEVEELNSGCALLGIFDELPQIKIGEVYVKPGSLLFNYTDGLIEFENEDGLQFEVTQLSDFINANHDATAQPFNALLLDTIDKFKGDRPFMDDISILTCRFL